MTHRPASVPTRTREQRLGSFVGGVACVLLAIVAAVSQQLGWWSVVLVLVAVPTGAVFGHFAASILDFLDG